MTSIEQNGRTVEDAVKAALKILGVSRDDVDVEVLSQESRGLLGILGYSEAKVRVTVKASLQAPPPPPAPAPPAASRGRGRRRLRPQTGGGRTRRGGPALPEEDLSETARRAISITNEILSLMSLPAQAEATQEEEDAVYLTIHDEDDPAVLIGKHGQTLAALQLISAMIVNRPLEADARKRVILDAANYRARRERALVQMAHHAADRARRTGREVPLEAMGSRERRLIHVTLADDATVTTRSEGDDPNRFVVIVPKRPRRDSPPPAAVSVALSALGSDRRAYPSARRQMWAWHKPRGQRAGATVEDPDAVGHLEASRYPRVPRESAVPGWEGPALAALRGAWRWLRARGVGSLLRSLRLRHSRGGLGRQAPKPSSPRSMIPR